MANQKVVSINSTANNKIKAVSIEELKGLMTVPEQFALLERSGYKKGPRNPFISTSFKEWALILNADRGNHITYDSIDVLDVDKITVPFLLKDSNGVVVDEYNFSLYYYWDPDWDTESDSLIAQCWIKGGEQETAFTMPLSENPTHEGFRSVYDRSANYVLSAFDIKCCEEMMGYCYRGDVNIYKLVNGSFVLAFCAFNGDSWYGFPVCGDGNEERYREELIYHLPAGYRQDNYFELGKDDCMTFPTREAAQAWADRIGLKLYTE